MILAFLTGLLGSFHCLGMCGPLLLSIPFKNWQTRYVYQSGRILVYVIWGTLLGFFGSLAYWGGLQQTLSIGLGIVMLVILFIPHFSFFGGKLWSTYIIKFRHFLLPKIKKNATFYYFILGIFNGLLPCGLVYVAAIGASVTGLAWEGALYMLLFGLGTLPMTLLISSQKKYLFNIFKNKIKYIIPTLLFLTAILLILRGLNLNIPYISPYIESGQAHCH